MRLRGERVERSFAHCLETGGMRRTWLRGHVNILKRYLVHVAGFNLGLVMRQMFGAGTPRGVAGRAGFAQRLCALARALVSQLDEVIAGVRAIGAKILERALRKSTKPDPCLKGPSSAGC